MELVPRVVELWWGDTESRAELGTGQRNSSSAAKGSAALPWRCQGLGQSPSLGCDSLFQSEQCLQRAGTSHPPCCARLLPGMLMGLQSKEQ